MKAKQTLQSGEYLLTNESLSFKVSKITSLYRYHNPVSRLLVVAASLKII